MTAPILSFLIPVRNDAARLERCLASVRQDAGATPIEIIVADNGSTDDSPDVARSAGALVLNLPSRRVSELRNLAAAQATGGVLAFVDADHHLAPGWTAAALQSVSGPNVWATGADYHTPPEGTWVQQSYDLFRDHAVGPRPVEWLPSGNLVVRRAAFEHVQGFDTSLESCEDVDFCRRVRAAGGQIIANGALHSTHHGDPKTLKALFFAELWRGRDNLRVSLREPLTLGNSPSVVFPILHLFALALVAGGALLSALGGRGSWPVLGGLAVAAALSSARALRMWSRLPRSKRNVRRASQTWVVAAVYDLARALALVARAGHDVRRKG